MDIKNQVMLVGFVGKDPETRTFDSGNSVTSFSLATSSKRKDKQGELIEDTQWHNVVAWGKMAETIQKNVKKGTGLIVHGSIAYRSYEKDGITKYITEIRMGSFAFNGSSNAGQSNNAPFPKEEPVSQPAGTEGGADDDPLPF